MQLGQGRNVRPARPMVRFLPPQLSSSSFGTNISRSWQHLIAPCSSMALYSTGVHSPMISNNSAAPVFAILRPK